MPENILFNKKGIEWYHIIIGLVLIGLIFFVPFKTDTLVLDDFSWTFLDKDGNDVSPIGKTIRGGFGTTSDPQKLEVGYTTGTTLLAQTPYGPESAFGTGTAYSVLLSFPKSEILVTHKSNCAGSKSDGVSLEISGQKIALFEEQKKILTNEIIISPNEHANCDWVWISGKRKETFWDFYLSKYLKKKSVLIPAQPFSIEPLGI